ncbi:hypothetical protein BaRGS_00029778 [Batillaria attramentaria]|uniref:Uncharacterized protein n=1 Tax=Batillaria attramentaria TaxID=370345 RepID=A0ABD0JVC4_9CAEN
MGFHFRTPRSLIMTWSLMAGLIGNRPFSLNGDYAIFASMGNGDDGVQGLSFLKQDSVCNVVQRTVVKFVAISGETVLVMVFFEGGFQFNSSKISYTILPLLACPSA